MRRRTFLAGVAAGTVPLVAGCTDGGEGDGDGGPAANPTESPASTATEPATGAGTDTPTPTEAAGGARASYPEFNWERIEGVDPVATDAVTLRDVRFDPPVAAVEPGTEVTFANEDAAGHTVTIPALDVDRQLDGGDGTTVVFEETGTYEYVCTIHPPDMLGRMVVTENPPGARATATETATETGTATETETATPTETEGGDGGGGGYY